MQLLTPTRLLFAQLQAVLEELTQQDYTTPSQHLSGCTIGQHVRHIIELFVELNKGYESGTVNYEGRQRDYQLENDNGFAIEALDDILHQFLKHDKSLALLTDLSLDGSGCFSIGTTYYREIIFNIEHTVHHMALVRVAVQELTDIVLPNSFGVAATTIKHQQSLCAQ